MTPEQTLTYKKFVAAVSQNKPNTVAELLYLHPFLVTELESSINQDTYISPFVFATANPERLELAKVLRAFGSEIRFESKYYPTREITAYQEIYTPLIEDNPAPFIPEDIAPDLKNLAAQDLNVLKTDMIKKYHLDPIKQLYILTGEEPINCDRTINPRSKGPHLRFVLPKEAGVRIEQTKTLLKAFGIAYCDGFRTEFSRYITVAPEMYPKLNRYFSFPLNYRSSQLNLSALSEDEKNSLLAISSSSEYLSGLIKRNNEQYPLDTPMIFLTKFNIKNGPGFKYLKEKGHEFEHQVILNSEPSPNAAPEEKTGDVLAADQFRMLYFTADYPSARTPAAPISAGAGRLQLTNKTSSFKKL